MIKCRYCEAVYLPAAEGTIEGMIKGHMLDAHVDVMQETIKKQPLVINDDYWREQVFVS